MNQADGKSTKKETQTIGGKILDFVMSFLGSFILANIGIILLGQFNDPQPIWASYFIWFWRLLITSVAIFAFTKKRIWISMGIVTVLYIQAFGI
jgi:uncharacterized membrane protein YbhN (UPF0104 family)